MFAETQQPVFLSEDWTGPLATQRLAQLLHSLSSGKAPITLKAPLTIEVPDGVSPINVRNWTNGNTAITFTNPSGSTVNTVTVGTNGVNTTTGGGGGTTTTTTTGGGGMPGQVVSGTGNTYTVAVYPDGLSGGSINVSVRQLQIDSGQTIPAGTWAIVARTTDGSYYMQVPVWLAAE